MIVMTGIKLCDSIEREREKETEDDWIEIPCAKPSK